MSRRWVDAKDLLPTPAAFAAMLAADMDQQGAQDAYDSLYKKLRLKGDGMSQETIKLLDRVDLQMHAVLDQLDKGVSVEHAKHLMAVLSTYADIRHTLIASG